MNILSYKLLFKIITIFLFCSSYLYAEDRLGYRGVMLGMTMKQISNLDSVKSGYMPDLNKLKSIIDKQYGYHFMYLKTLRNLSKNADRFDKQVITSQRKLVDDTLDRATKYSIIYNANCKK